MHDRREDSSTVDYAAQWRTVDARAYAPVKQRAPRRLPASCRTPGHETRLAELIYHGTGGEPLFREPRKELMTATPQKPPPPHRGVMTRIAINLHLPVDWTAHDVPARCDDGRVTPGGWEARSSNGGRIRAETGERLLAKVWAAVAGMEKDRGEGRDFEED